MLSFLGRVRFRQHANNCSDCPDFCRIRDCTPRLDPSAVRAQPSLGTTTGRHGSTALHPLTTNWILPRRAAALGHRRNWRQLTKHDCAQEHVSFRCHSDSHRPSSFDEFSKSERLIYGLRAVLVRDLARLSTGINARLLGISARFHSIPGTGKTGTGRSILGAGNQPGNALIPIRIDHPAIRGTAPAAVGQGQLFCTLLTQPTGCDARIRGRIGRGNCPPCLMPLTRRFGFADHTASICANVIGNCSPALLPPSRGNRS